jgi:hypothetical protein
MPSHAVPKFFTISGLIYHSAPGSTFKRAGWAKNAKFWSSASQVLPTPPTARRGSGRHRRYREEDAFVMAVIFRLAEMALPIGVLHQVSIWLQDIHEDDEDWQKAKLGHTDPPIFLSIIFSDEEPFVSIHPGPFSEDFEEDAEGGTILMNISEVFARVRATMEGAANEQ